MRDIVVPHGTPQDSIELRANEVIFARPYANDYIEVYTAVDPEEMLTKEQRLRYRKQKRKFKQ